MPRIRHWFHVTHDINGDPEMWELRDKYGERAGFVWLEILSIADRQEGLVGRDLDQLRNQLASKCRTSRVKVCAIIDWCRERSWLLPDRAPMPSGLHPGSNPAPTRLEPGSSRDDIELVSRLGLRVRNYREYNPTRDAKKNGLASPPILSSPIPSENHKNDSKKQPPAAFQIPDWIPKEAWEEFKEHRARKRAKLTDKIASRLIRVLEELRDQGYEPDTVLHKAIDRNWVAFEADWITKNGKNNEENVPGLDQWKVKLQNN